MADTLNSKCSKIVCPAVEAKMCVKINSMNAKLTQYVKISRCEMELISCYRAVSTTVVPSKFCAVKPPKRGNEITNIEQRTGNDVSKQSVRSEDNVNGSWQFQDNCPRECPVRRVMVCARCKHGVHRTFMSDCYMRMYQCKHPDDELELVARRPCLGSAPLLDDLPQPVVALSEPMDNDPVLDHISAKKSDDGPGSYYELKYSSKNQSGYGTEWIFFPDGDGIPHFVNLTVPVAKKLVDEIKKIVYRLYVRGIPDYIILDQSARPTGNIKIRDLITKKHVKLVTHGWRCTAEDLSVKSIKDTYLKVKDVAVITVDWGSTATNTVYPTVAHQTKRVGSRVGEFLNAFCKLYDVTGDRLHLIGHSLGAHVVGLAASKSNIMIARITGLDPARPLFEYPKVLQSLKSSDGKFVDIIHSCGGDLGFQNPGGHADFYPNSGASPQPGCEDLVFYSKASCSHGRAYIYFTESIANPTGFPACRSVSWNDYARVNQCKEKTYMGDNVNLKTTGQYYLKTNAKEPYAIN